MPDSHKSNDKVDNVRPRQFSPRSTTEVSVAIPAIGLTLLWRVEDGVVAGIKRQVSTLQCFFPLPVFFRPILLNSEKPIELAHQAGDADAEQASTGALMASRTF